MDNRLYWIWLQQALGAGSPKSNPLLRALESPERVFEADDAFLREIGMTDKERRALSNKSLDESEKILRKALKHNGWVLTPDDALYPAVLREIYALPLVLYGRGEWPDWEELPALAMVGTRKATPYGLQMAGYLAGSVASAGIAVVSGGAVGIDAASHQGALAVGGRTVVVQGCGLDVNYPKPNHRLREQVLAQGGAIISEYPPGTAGWKGNFPLRNRLISGLSWATCVVEADIDSGSLITATHAREQGREVMAVPGPAGMSAYAGNNSLIRKGALLVETGEDILRPYRDRFGKWLPQHPTASLQPPRFDAPSEKGTERPRMRVTQPRPKAVPKQPEPVAAPPACTGCPDFVSAEGHRMFDLLQETPRPIDWLADKAALSPARAMAVLTELEIAGAARSHPGQQYSR